MPRFFLFSQHVRCRCWLDQSGPYRLYASVCNVYTTICWDCVLTQLRSLCASLVFLHWRERGMELVRLFLSFSVTQPGCGSLDMCVKQDTNPVWSTRYRWSKISSLVVTAQSDLSIVIQHHWLQVLVVLKIGHWSWTECMPEFVWMLDLGGCLLTRRLCIPCVPNDSDRCYRRFIMGLRMSLKCLMHVMYDHSSQHRGYLSHRVY